MTALTFGEIFFIGEITENPLPVDTCVRTIGYLSSIDLSSRSCYFVHRGNSLLTSLEIVEMGVVSESRIGTLFQLIGYISSNYNRVAYVHFFYFVLDLLT